MTKRNKKLTLHKETLRSLENNDLRAVNGGLILPRLPPGTMISCQSICLVGQIKLVYDAKLGCAVRVQYMGDTQGRWV